MSTPETPEQSHPRRRRMAVASVAAAVLLAGGGGAYWASNATGPDDTSPASDGRKAPPSLTLDSYRPSPDGGKPEQGIAPGEPNPGGGTVYKSDGKLPDGPGWAEVRRPDGDLKRSEVAAIAEALGVQGKPVQEDGRWRVGSTKDGSGSQLTVDDRRGGANWSYVHNKASGDDRCGKPKDGEMRIQPVPCPAQPPEGDGSKPVSAKEAVKVVRPALQPLHLQGAKLTASATYDSLRVVTAEPRVDGMPVDSWVSSFTVNSAGELVRGHGHIGDLVKGAEYPVMTAEETLKEMNQQRGGSPSAPKCSTPAKPGTGDAKTDGGISKDATECDKPNDAANTLEVKGATFGLGAEYSKGKPVLVPSWIFEVQQKGSDGTYRVTHTAIETKYLRAPEKSGDDTSSPGDKRALVSYTAEDRELTVTFWGGVCHDYRATVKEQDEKVAVSVEPKNAEPRKPCIMMAKKQQVKVELDEPLDGREVVDAKSGKALKKK